MKKRLMLPAMAFVFAIGLSFATESSTADAEWDYIYIGTQQQKIVEVECVVDIGDCEGQLDREGPSFPIYDGPDDTTPKQGTMINDELLVPVN